MIQQAEEKSRDLYQQLAGGRRLCRTRTGGIQCPQCAAGVGELGWRRESELPEPLAVAIGKLSPGQISQPVRTPGGFHILKVEDKRGGKVQLVNQVKVRHILLTAK